MIKDLDYRFNIPFSHVNQELVEQLTGREYNYEDYLRWSKYMDASPSIWNLGVFDDIELIFFLYGLWNPLEKEMEIKRATMLKEFWPNKWELVGEAIRHMRFACAELGVKHLYFITPKWEGYMKGIDCFKEIPMRMLEVI
ncbi:MAG: hypothetical protein WC097_07755 [Eubacteriales bacterium]